ncbi:SusC/RagA family TonB-linked outer membrane protein [Mucilaginibacter sp. BJC16-A38]|uniref:SusC/RagA family TonB-linked outer membrane protein n=1 Tax=Mucilaginibacter phenanthrenivorans TaxID=1234842 RepID=UPI0021587E9A|nr:SusC/RagA family TonB-linked outer membrane protein [Mucilaginibacter phenanthrenivorans]MCR8560763.1 SusC/RagA family TonB-linked outer membrane protein [Mucilaginibacter phenanthrenivorans]
MKLTTLILVTAILQVSANAFSQKITLSEKNSPLNKVFEKISEQTGYDFLVSTENLKQAKSVTIHVQEEDLKAALDIIFSDQPLSFVIQEKMVVVTKKAPASAAKNKNDAGLPIKIKGRVMDTAGTPLPGATIKIKNSAKTSFTDADGHFEIAAIKGDEVEVTFIGYASFTFIAEKDESFLQVTLSSSTAKLKEISVISTGYQTIPKDRATGSFATVDNELLNRRVSPDLLSRLEGVVPGLLFNRNTANSSQGLADISIRGNSTLFANSQPLVVLDGFPYDGDLSTINPNNVENITVLKDAAAASIWGVRSGNGVIVITTKKGSRNQSLKAEFNANITLSTNPDLKYNPNYLPSSTFISIERNLFNAGYYDGDLSRIAPVSPVVQLLADERAGTLNKAAGEAQIASLAQNDVRSDLSKYFYRKSVSQQYALSLKGGGANDDYYISVGYDKGLSNLIKNQNDRKTISTTYNYYVLPGLTLSSNINYVQSSSTNDNTIGQLTFGSHNTIYPYAKLADASGNPLAIIHKYPQSFLDSVGSGKLLDWSYKPVDELNDADNTVKTNSARLQFGAKYDFLKYLSASINYQYLRESSHAENDYSLNTYYARSLINQFTQIGSGGNLTYPIPADGILEQGNSLLRTNTVRGQINYHQTFNPGNELTAILGAEIRSTVLSGNGNTIYGYEATTAASNQSIDYTTNYNFTDGGGGKIPTILSLSQTTNRYISYYANAAYTYLGRYTLSASGRIDKSNLFGVNTNQKAVPLYSGGFSWNLSKEPFYKVEALPYLKIRSTYGLNGNVNTNATAQTTIREFYNLNPYSPIPFDLIINPGNPELRFEKIRMINLGLDFSLKNNIISGALEYYLKKGNDLFGYSPLAPSTGLTSFFGNNADIEGHGFDIQINANLKKGSFGWNASFLFSHATDKVTGYGTEMSGNDYVVTGNASSVTPLQGKSLFGIYSYRWGGLTHDTGNPQGYDATGKLTTDYNAIINGTTLSNMVYNGSARPLYFGSFRNTFSYGQLSLSLNFTYKLDYYFRRQSYTSSALPYDGNKDYFKRWQKPGDEVNTNVPSYQPPPFDNSRDDFYYYSSALIDRGDHIRFQDLTLSYGWDKASVKHLPFSHLQLYSYINNIGIIWRANHDGLDPDLLVGSYLSQYPLPTTFSIGFKITP